MEHIYTQPYIGQQQQQQQQRSCLQFKRKPTTNQNKRINYYQ